MQQQHDQTDPIETRARRRVNIQMGFYIHALVFVVVNLGLYAISSAKGGGHWSNLPLLGWGIGLAIHGLVTFISLQGDGMRSRMLAREIERLRRDQR